MDGKVKVLLRTTQNVERKWKVNKVEIKALLGCVPFTKKSSKEDKSFNQFRNYAATEKH